MNNPIRPTDEEARQLAQALMAQARFAALGVVDDAGCPLVTRVAFGLCPLGQPVSLVSNLSAHTKALKANPVCSLLVGEPGDRGDPLTHPRLSLQGRACLLDNESEEHTELADHYLRSHPKAKLYIGFADFFFVRFAVEVGFLNGGFGKAFHMLPKDLSQPG